MAAETTPNGARCELSVEVVGPRTSEVERVVSVLRGHGTGTAAPRVGAVRARRRVYVINCLRSDGTSSSLDVARVIARVRRRAARSAIVALLDESDPAAVRAARTAGATIFIGSREAANEEAIHWRVVMLGPLIEDVPRSHRRARTARPSPGEAAAARAAVDASVAGLMSPGERLAGASGLVSVDAPALRDPRSGRFDAKRIATALGVSIARLAPAVGVTQQALSAKPDSPRAQAALLPIARIMAALDEALPTEQHRMWLNTPRAEFGEATPLVMIEQGKADTVARAVEGALEGHPD